MKIFSPALTVQPIKVQIPTIPVGTESAAVGLGLENDLALSQGFNPQLFANDNQPSLLKRAMPWLAGLANLAIFISSAAIVLPLFRRGGNNESVESNLRANHSSNIKDNATSFDYKPVSGKYENILRSVFENHSELVAYAISLSEGDNRYQSIIQLVTEDNKIIGLPFNVQSGMLVSELRALDVGNDSTALKNTLAYRNDSLKLNLNRDNIHENIDKYVYHLISIYKEHLRGLRGQIKQTSSTNFPYNRDKALEAIDSLLRQKDTYFVDILAQNKTTLPLSSGRVISDVRISSALAREIELLVNSQVPLDKEGVVPDVSPMSLEAYVEFVRKNYLEGENSIQSLITKFEKHKNAISSKLDELVDDSRDKYKIALETVEKQIYSHKSLYGSRAKNFYIDNPNEDSTRLAGQEFAMIHNDLESNMKILMEEIEQGDNT